MNVTVTKTFVTITKQFCDYLRPTYKQIFLTVAK